MIEQPNQYTILVSGATGQQGGAVARNLLARGFRVRALTRSGESPAAQALVDAGAELANGAFDDPASVDSALENAYGAYSVQNFMTAGGAEGEFQQGKAFADAAQRAGIQHFVYSSVGGAERDTGIPHFDSKWRIEEYIRTLNLPTTILRPVFFMENWFQFTGDAIRGGTLPQPLSPDTALQQIAVDDIGAIAALAFANPETWIGRAVELAGDELTMTQVATTLGTHLGHEVNYLQVPWDDFEAQVGPEMATMYRWFGSHGYAADLAAIRESHPKVMDLASFMQTGA